MKTTIIISSIVIVLLIALRWAYVAFRNSTCCGTCGCNILTDKQKKKMLAKRAKKEKRKSSK